MRWDHSLQNIMDVISGRPPTFSASGAPADVGTSVGTSAFSPTHTGPGGYGGDPNFWSNLPQSISSPPGYVPHGYAGWGNGSPGAQDFSQYALWQKNRTKPDFSQEDPIFMHQGPFQYTPRTWPAGANSSQYGHWGPGRDVGGGMTVDPSWVGNTPPWFSDPGYNDYMAWQERRTKPADSTNPRLATSPSPVQTLPAPGNPPAPSPVGGGTPGGSPNGWNMPTFTGSNWGRDFPAWRNSSANSAMPDPFAGSK